MPQKRKFNQFASDNYAGICPEAWRAMESANTGFVPSYGDDVWTERACESIRQVFETDCQVFFVFNGTAANSLALAALCRSYHSVICHDLAHVETDECGAPEFFSNGTKILHIHGAGGKLDLAEVERAITRRSDIHYPRPKVLSLTQATEVGTVYTPAEIRSRRRSGSPLWLTGPDGRGSFCQRGSIARRCSGQYHLASRSRCALPGRRKKRHGAGRSGCFL